MEIKGEDFIKKVQLKQEENEIEQRLNEIKNAQAVYEGQEENSIPEQTRRNVAPDLDRELQMQEEQEYSDIMLGKMPNSSSNENNKKKYLVLGLVLVILFLLTIIIIRLLTNDSNEDESFSKTQHSENKQTILENENIEEQYQKIINEKLKNIKEENATEETLQNETTELNLEKIEEKEKIVEKPIQNTKPDVFNVKKVVQEEPKVEKKIQPKPKPIVKKETPKPIVKKSSSNNNITRKPQGTFVQIGAFSKMPNDKYLTSITQKGFKYKIYKVSINNKMFHKVLIGPYNSRGQAKLAIDNIKKELNISGAFILTF